MGPNGQLPEQQSRVGLPDLPKLEHQVGLPPGREMMHGLRETSTISECRDCGCLQIVDFPSDLQRYYPSHYYSLKPRPATARSARSSSSSRRRSGSIGSRSSSTRRRRRPCPNSSPPIPAADSHPRHRCGQRRLSRMALSRGFRNLHGIDPNLSKAQERSFPFWLERATIETLAERRERYAFVYLSHSLEHMPDQQEALGLVRRVLAPGGVCCVRISVDLLRGLGNVRPRVGAARCATPLLLALQNELRTSGGWRRVSNRQAVV